jgi:hypothetical protein
MFRVRFVGRNDIDAVIDYDRRYTPLHFAAEAGDTRLYTPKISYKMNANAYLCLCPHILGVDLIPQESEVLPYPCGLLPPLGWRGPTLELEVCLLQPAKLVFFPLKPLLHPVHCEHMY